MNPLKKNYCGRYTDKGQYYPCRAQSRTEKTRCRFFVRDVIDYGRTCAFYATRWGLPCCSSYVAQKHARKRTRRMEIENRWTVLAIIGLAILAAIMFWARYGHLFT